MSSLIKSLLRSIGVVLVVTFATFALMYGNAPGIAQSVLGLSASPESIQQKIMQLGLDRPLLVQYWNWIAGVVTGDLGRSYYTSESVSKALSNRVPVTLTLVLMTLGLTAIFSVLLGVFAAVKGGWIDRVVQWLSVLGTAVPGYVIAIVLVFAFAVMWRLFPATGYVPPHRNLTQWFMSLVLPVSALLIGAVAGVATQIRSAMLDMLDRDFVRTLRARGIDERLVLFRHVLRNAAAPGLTALSLTMIALLGGAVFIELVFALPGMGQLANASAQISDVPMVMGTVLVTIVLVLATNLLADIGVALLNPKSRS
ncbi:ABC transporter permease [Devosia rhodophyticola]|uniref:ABC transporter permease n=1 Tax=Devosia rhodophyticola TaxID=3026423 RepID=A0ABY7YXF4_9HYPH|nr:ABC transporter permease [Devosia rhodophyticola]WDR06068.1 ABC transporter permease [Devosia rhodophyticola]